MDMGTVLSAAQTLLAALQCSELKEAFSIFSYKTQLNELRDTVQTINAVLRDAETKLELSQQEQIWMEKLRDAVFEADDLFDEFLTLAELEKFRKAHGSLSNEVSSFFSLSTNPLTLAYKMSHGVKDIRNKLKAIVDNSQFCFKIDPRQSSFKIDHEPIRKRSRETCSYVNEAGIIGREHDLESIVGKLLASDDQSDLRVLSIVGMGGLGKTALAQLVYNDPMVTNAFPLKMWTCVSDEGHKELNLKNILCKILGHNLESFTLEEVRSQLQDHLARDKYLLVLDDVWTENRDHWCKLVEYLVGGKRGSYIIVTTRSQNTATITGGQVHELSGLSEENSWLLFEKTAFAPHQSNPPDDELVEIGRKIVDSCVGVPLAIRVAGSLLYGQEKNKWINVQKIGLANIRNANNGIVPILELSFHHLESPVKNCFSYCALFPKDYELKKKVLMSLWMAQGYIVELDNGQSIEDAAEEYFSILSKRCFFQDIKRNKHGEIKSCKIHDLMHDIVQNVSGKKISALNAISGNVKEYIRYLSISNMSQFEKCYSLGNLSSFKRLRALDLSNKYIKSLPDSIGELLHLRYIDLSWNQEMEALPKSITKLCNLLTLKLRGCKKLKKFPKDFTRLIKLRVLDVKVCFALRWLMPRCRGKMTCLTRLKVFTEWVVERRGIQVGSNG